MFLNQELMQHFIVQAIDISQDPDNSDVTSPNANILVRINNHFLRSGTGV